MLTTNSRQSYAIPQSFNRYAYVNNDPVNLVDPSGLDPLDPSYFGGDVGDGSGGSAGGGGVLTTIGLEKAFGGFWRGVVELTGLDAAEVAGVTDAATDSDCGRLETLPHSVTDFQP